MCDGCLKLKDKVDELVEAIESGRYLCKWRRRSDTEYCREPADSFRVIFDADSCRWRNAWSTRLSDDFMSVLVITDYATAEEAMIASDERCINQGFFISEENRIIR